jgi:hypothetical protein
MLAVNPWTLRGVIDTQALCASGRARRERVRGMLIVTLQFRPAELRVCLRLLDVVPHRSFV